MVDPSHLLRWCGQNTPLTTVRRHICRSSKESLKSLDGMAPMPDTVSAWPRSEPWQGWHRCKQWHVLCHGACSPLPSEKLLEQRQLRMATGCIGTPQMLMIMNCLEASSKGFAGKHEPDPTWWTASSCQGRKQTLNSGDWVRIELVTSVHCGLVVPIDLHRSIWLDDRDHWGSPLGKLNPINYFCYL